MSIPGTLSFSRIWKELREWERGVSSTTNSKIGFPGKNKLKRSKTFNRTWTREAFSILARVASSHASKVTSASSNSSVDSTQANATNASICEHGSQKFKKKHQSFCPLFLCVLYLATLNAKACLVPFAVLDTEIGTSGIKSFNDEVVVVLNLKWVEGSETHLFTHIIYLMRGERDEGQGGREGLISELH